MDVEAMSNRERFLGQLPFYANGTLAEAERAWMDDRAAEDHGLQRAIDNELKLAQLVRASVDSLEPRKGTEEALANALKVWRQRRVQKAWWHPFVNLPRIVLAFISALAAMSFAQWVYIATVMTGVAYAPSRSLMPECHLEPLVRFTLRPDARWEDIVILVRGQGLLIRQGPNENGQISLAVASGKTAEAAVNAVAQDQLVQLAEVLAPAQTPECKP